MGRYAINLQLGNLGTLQYEDESEEEFVKNLANIYELKEKALAILTKKGASTETGRYPNIGKAESYPDAIEKALSTDWGLEPRILHEIHNALADNAIHITKQALGSLLIKMIRANRLSRIRKNGVYAYTLPLQRRQ